MGLRKMGLSMGFLGFVFLSGLLLSMAQVTPADYYFVLEETNFTRNCVTKSMLTVNGMFPGPEIRVHEGDTVNVNVYNNGTYGVTLHWHGVKQPSNPWSDGPEYVTQCPIRPGTNFTQQIIFSDEIGTLWWHAHSDWTRATVHGAIIVEPVGKNYPDFMQHDNETTIVLASWFNGNVMDEADTAEDHSNPNEADAYTINGLPGNYLNNCTTDSTFNMTVNSNETYLLRIVNAVMNEDMFFSIANHNLTVVGIDGAYVEPINTNYIMIGPGNTMDALVKADKDSTKYYYMAASTFHFGNGPDVETRTTSAILMYNGSNPTAAPVFPTDTLPNQGNFTKANEFVDLIKSNPTIPQQVPNGSIDHRYIIDVAVNNTDGMFASLSNISFVLPSTESILDNSFSCITGAATCNDIDKFEPPYPNTTTNGTNMILVNYNDTVEIVFQGSTAGAEDHPMHLHGHSFYLIGRKFNATFDNETDPDDYDLTNAPLLNTVGVPYQGWAAIRFIANNPGAWFIHCHLERHASWGMGTAIIVRESEKKMIQRPNDMPSCSAT